MKQSKLQQLAAQDRDLQIVIVDGDEYLMGNFQNFFLYAHEHHLRINVMEQVNGQGWAVMPWFTADGLYVDTLVQLHFDEEYYVLPFNKYFKKFAEKHVECVINGGASPVDVENTIKENNAVMRMYLDKKLGHDTGMAVVAKRDYSGYSLVPNNGQCVSFNGVTMAIALSEPKREQTELAIELMKSGRKIPCLNGMMPEDVLAVVDDDTRREYDLRQFGRRSQDDDGTYSMGPFIIVDEESGIGYAYRSSIDGIYWYWVDGEHCDTDVMSSEEIEKNSWIEDLCKKSNARDFAYWMKLKTNERDEYGTLCSLPILDIKK